MPVKNGPAVPQLLWNSKWTSLQMCQENEPFLLPWNRIDHIQIEIIKCIVDAFIFFARTSITTLRHAWTLKSALCIVFRALFMARLIISCARFQAIVKRFLALFNTDIVIVRIIRICLAFLSQSLAQKLHTCIACPLSPYLYSYTVLISIVIETRTSINTVGTTRAVISLTGIRDFFIIFERTGR